MPNTDYVNFDGKVVSFSSGENSLAMKDVNFQWIKGRLFVVGIIPVGATTNDWAVQKISAIAWDSILDYMIFDSESQYKELINKSE